MILITKDKQVLLTENLEARFVLDESVSDYTIKKLNKNPSY